jgi:hypothetical protein
VRSPREGPAGRSTNSGTAHTGGKSRESVRESEGEARWGNQPHKGRGLAWNPDWLMPLYVPVDFSLKPWLMPLYVPVDWQPDWQPVCGTGNIHATWVQHL